MKTGARLAVKEIIEMIALRVLSMNGNTITEYPSKSENSTMKNHVSACARCSPVTTLTNAQRVATGGLSRAWIDAKCPQAAQKRPESALCGIITGLRERGLEEPRACSLVGATWFRRGSCLGLGSEPRLQQISLNRLQNTIAKPQLALAA